MKYTVLLLLFIVFQTTFAQSTIQINSKYSTIKEAWEESLGDHKELTILNYSFHSINTLATVYFSDNRASGFVLVSKKSLDTESLNTQIADIIKEETKSKGIPTKILGKEISREMVANLQDNEIIEIAQWNHKKNIYKIGIAKKKDHIFLTFSGAKTKM